MAQQSWSNEERTKLIRRLARGEISVAEAAKTYDLPLKQLQSWVDEYFSSGKISEPADPAALRERDLLERMPQGDAILLLTQEATTLAKRSADHHAMVRLFIPGRTFDEAMAMTSIERRRALEIIDELLTEGGLRPSGGLRSEVSVVRPVLPGMPFEPPPSDRSLGPILLGVGILAGLISLVFFLVEDPADGASQGPPPTAASPALAEDGGEAPSEPPPNRAEPCPEGMVYHPPGTYQVTLRTADPAATGASTLRKKTSVTLPSFCLDRHEVSAGDYAACVGRSECEPAQRTSTWPQGKLSKKAWERAQEVYSALCNSEVSERAAHPINCVTWYQAAHYCGALGKRLPSGQEWEAAARGEGRSFPWGDASPVAYLVNACGEECRTWRSEQGLDPGVAMYEAEDGWPGTAPVGSFTHGQTPAGVHDLAGNVAEWTAEGPPASASAEDPPATPPATPLRELRGGDFSASSRESLDPGGSLLRPADSHTHGIGFRCAKRPLFDPGPSRRPSASRPSE